MASLGVFRSFAFTPPSAAPAADWGARARKLAIPAAVAVAVVIGAVVLGGPARTFLHALERAVEANPLWVLAGVAFEILSFGGYVLLLWHVAGRDAPRLGFRESYQVTMAGLVATRLLPTAGMGGAALTLWSLQRAGHRGRDGARTLLTFLVVLYSVFLGTILVVGGLTAFGVLDASGPLALSALPAGLAGAAIVTALWLSGRPARPAPGPDASRLARARHGAGVLGEAVQAAKGVVRGGDPRLLGALAWWGFDIAVLWAAFHAVGATPPLAVVILGYFIGQVANTVPVPGAVSGGMVGVFVAFGVDPAITLAAVLAYRSMAIWIPAPFGATAAAGLKRTVARWSAEDGAPAAEEADEAEGERAVVVVELPAPRREPAGIALAA
jgi:putative heme transporter